MLINKCFKEKIFINLTCQKIAPSPLQRGSAKWVHLVILRLRAEMSTSAGDQIGRAHV